jgi:hypothetical protein
LDPWSNPFDVFPLLRRMTMMMRMMVELMGFWISVEVEVEEVLRNLLEKVELLNSQIGGSVMPIWLIG